MLGAEEKGRQAWSFPGGQGCGLVPAPALLFETKYNIATHSTPQASKGWSPEMPSPSQNYTVSRFIGVNSLTGGKSWRSRLSINSTFPDDVMAHYAPRNILALGSFDTEELAAHAHDV